MSHHLLLLARPLFAEITITLGAFFLILFSLGKICAKNIAKLSLSVLLLAAMVLLLLPNENAQVSESFARFFTNNDYIVVAKLLVLVFSSLICALYISIHEKNKEFTIIMLFAVLGMLLMLAANDFLSLYLSLELQSLCLYVLASYDHKQIKSTEAGIKYFILSAISSGLMLYGISLIYGFGGSTNFVLLKQIIYQENYLNLGLLVGLILLLIGFFL